MSIVLSILNFLIALFVCYFLLVDGVRLKGAVVAFLGPMRMDFERRCLEKIDSTLCGIYMGSIYTAIAGGLTSVAIFLSFWSSAALGDGKHCLLGRNGSIPNLVDLYTNGYYHVL
jgi:predicted PurR-regulated permease PerM